MFEYTHMNQAVTVRSLQRRIAEMQPMRLDERALPTPPELGGLLPGGALRAGTAITVQGSLHLALALLSAVSASGAWCGAIGLPELGLEAVARLGLDLNRFVLAPEPGAHALGIAATLSEVLAAVILAPADRVSPGDAARLAAKLRDRGTALIALGPWPSADSRLRVTASRWAGLGQGYGLLAAHELHVQSEDQRGTLRHTISFENGRLRPC